MDKTDKPRLAEVLGVDVNERFRLPVNGGTLTFWVTETGYFETDPPQQVGSTYLLLDAINHPESIIRAPRLTEAERERCRVCGAKYVCMDKHPNGYVALHSAKPVLHEGGYYCENNYIGTLDSDLFPSVHPGDCICVEEVQHDD